MDTARKKKKRNTTNSIDTGDFKSDVSKKSIGKIDMLNLRRHLSTRIDVIKIF